MARFKRLLTIIQIIIRYRLDTFLPVDRFPGWLQLLAGPLKLKAASDSDRAERLRRALEDLGPVFVKLGQLLSTRRDILPDDLADELCLLQDNVKPFPSDQSIALIEQALEAPIDSLFDAFEPEPMASASVAQVHAATLLTGEEVVVKVIRPGIEDTIARDVELMMSLARFIKRFLPDGQRLKPVEVVDEYRHVIFDELDLMREAANSAQLRRHFKDSELLYIPEVYWDYCRSNVMVSERIDGIPVTDIAQLTAQSTNMQMLAERGVEIFFTQVFEHNFFHADMHPGNIFVSREHPDRPQYMAVDCAIIGALTDHDQYYVARNLIAAFRRDYRAVAELHVECGWVPENTRISEFESAIRTVCEPIFEKPLDEISFGHVLLKLFQTARRFEMEVQPSLVLLQKTLLNVEGLGRQLYPKLDLWKTAHPFMERWLKRRYGPAGIVRSVRDRLPEWIEQLPEMPERVANALEQVQQIQHITPELERLRQDLKSHRKTQRQRALFGGLALVALGSAGLTMGQPSTLQPETAPVLAWAVILLGLWQLGRR